MSRRSQDRRAARRAKTRKRWPETENARSEAIPPGLEGSKLRAYSGAVRGGLAGPAATFKHRPAKVYGAPA